MSTDTLLPQVAQKGQIAYRTAGGWRPSAKLPATALASFSGQRYVLHLTAKMARLAILFRSIMATPGVLDRVYTVRTEKTLRLQLDRGRKLLDRDRNCAGDVTEAKSVGPVRPRRDRSHTGAREAISTKQKGR